MVEQATEAAKGFQTVSRPLPANFSDDDLALFERDLVKEIPKPRIVEFDNVKITAEGILFRGGLMMSESFARPENFRRWNRKRRNKRYEEDIKLRRVREAESAVWVTDDWSKGYFHWLADVLPKLAIAAELLNDTTVLLPARFVDSALAADSFKLLGAHKFEFISANETLVANRLYVPIHAGESGDFDGAVINEVRRIVTNALPKVLSQRKRIYISRTHAKRRRIINEDEVVSVLGKFGFETVLAEDLSFAEQVQMFSSAGHLISIHGAGLSNMLFMPAGSRVMEFRKKDPRNSNCFFNMASALDLDFYYLFCDTVDEAQAPYSADLFVNTRSLVENLQKFLR